jgi:hypothetical protein
MFDAQLATSLASIAWANGQNGPLKAMFRPVTTTGQVTCYLATAIATAINGAIRAPHRQ